MEFCVGCGHRLGVGRFCTNCGRPIGAGAPSGDTAERPPAPMPTKPPPSQPPPPPSQPPPPAYTAPPAPRFPLYADDLNSPDDRVIGPAAPPPSQPPGRTRPQRQGLSWLPLAATVVALMLMAVVGGLLLVSGDGGDPAGNPAPANGTAENGASPGSEAPSTDPTEPAPSDGPQDVARFATAAASKTARPNQDTAGNMVRYEPANLLDGVDQTCWRTPGDGTGEEIEFTLAEPTELTEVGLINGYAKSSGNLDWYAGNRNVLAVEWVFDDGTVLPQSFSDTREMQSTQIEPVTTSRVLLRLVSVSKPGRGPSARNFTAISGVSLVGEPA